MSFYWPVQLSLHEIVELIDIQSMTIGIFGAEVQARAHIGDFRQTRNMFTLPIPRDAQRAC